MAFARTSLWLSLALGLAASPLLASGPDAPQASASQRVVAALIKVNRAGTITDITPSHPLSQGLLNQLRADLEPVVEKGHPASGSRARQFVANMALDVTPTGNGNITVSFSLLSSTPLPGGKWFWSISDDRQVRLVRQEGASGAPAPGLRDPLQNLSPPVTAPAPPGPSGP